MSLPEQSQTLSLVKAAQKFHFMRETILRVLGKKIIKAPRGEIDVEELITSSNEIKQSLELELFSFSLFLEWKFDISPEALPFVAPGVITPKASLELRYSNKGLPSSILFIKLIYHPHMDVWFIKHRNGNILLSRIKGELEQAIGKLEHKEDKLVSQIQPSITAEKIIKLITTTFMKYLDKNDDNRQMA